MKLSIREVLIASTALMMACKGKQAPSSEPAGSGSALTAVASGSAAGSGSSAASSDCAEQTKDLRAWLDGLVADGTSPMGSRNGKLADTVESPANAKLLADAAWIDISPVPAAVDKSNHPCTTPACSEMVSMSGKVLTPARDLKFDQPLLRAELAKLQQKAGSLAVAADADAPWSALASIANISAAAGLDHIDFVLHATGASHVSAPPPSSIDAALSAAGDDNLAKRAGALDSVIKDCAPVAELFKAAGSGDSSSAERVVAGLPDAIAQCNCKVEINAVERIMWSAWNRDQPFMPLYVARLKLGSVTNPPKGPPSARSILNHPYAVWSTVAASIVDAGKQGDPVALGVISANH